MLLAPATIIGAKVCATRRQERGSAVSVCVLPDAAERPAQALDAQSRRLIQFVRTPSWIG
jgi:hypothetical protein